MGEALEKGGDLGVWAGGGDFDGSAIITQERDLGDGEDRALGEGGDGEAEAAALAGAGDGEALGIDLVAVGEKL